MSDVEFIAVVAIFGLLGFNLGLCIYMLSGVQKTREEIRKLRYRSDT